MRYREIMSETDKFIQGTPVLGKTLRQQLVAIGNPTVFYHASPMENADSIRINGLQPRAESRRKGMYGDYPNRVYMTTSDGMTRELQRDHSKNGRLTQYVVFAIDPRKLAPKTRLFRDPEDKASVYIEIAVPPAALTQIKADVTADDNSRYYAAVITILKRMGFVASASDDFAVDDEAILIYVNGEVTEADLARLNAALRQLNDPMFDEIAIQQVTDDWTELVGYITRP